MAWNLENYETVEDRLEKFWNDFPAARIETELLAHEGGRFIVYSRLYRDAVDTLPFATGLAEETITERGVNSTSALENCETSSVGRALANAGYAARGKRPSREEMAKVVRGDQGHKVEHPWKPAPEAVKELPNEPETYVWPDETEAKAFTDTTDIMSAFNAEIIGYTCKHGDMLLKEGNKNGKPYHGYVCSSRSKQDQCKGKWANMVNGKWVFEGRAAE